MKVSPNELTQLGYTLMDELSHKDLMPFIQTYLKKKTRYRTAYRLVNIVTVAIAAGCFYYYGRDQFSDAFGHLGYGFVLSFLLIPFHEYIHALAYRWQGAAQTSYDANLRKFYFMAIADQFVASRKEFRIVALAPFLTITLISLVLLCIVNGVWMVTVAGMLLAHTAMCSGDFGLLSYFDAHQDKEVVTYDDKAAGKSYFYGK